MMRPYMLANVRPYVLSAEGSIHSRQTTASASVPNCPEMIVVPPGSLMMGSPRQQAGRSNQEGPQQHVTIARPFAVSKYLVTFDDWEACVNAGGCPQVSDSGYDAGNTPITNITWNDAETYVEWLAKMTVKVISCLLRPKIRDAILSG